LAFIRNNQGYQIITYEFKEILTHIKKCKKKMTEENYVGVADRVKAVVTDSFVIIAFMIIISYIFSTFDHVPDNLRIVAFIFIFFLYDPLFTSIFGGTIGHMMFGIRVKQEKDLKRNIIFPLAIVRFIIKASLGWVSLLTVSREIKKQAIHDTIVNSVVIYKD
jgi:uncharacterized RDD family membrane protein YckC